MHERAADMIFVALGVDKSSSVPLHRQLYGGLRDAMLEGRLAAGTRLPSSRLLAKELGVSRNTVLNALTHLRAEGYLEGRVGSGTYVVRSLPEDLLRTRSEKARRRLARARRGIAERGERLVSAPKVFRADRGQPRAFRPGVPALDAFPSGEWGRLSARRWRRPPRGLLVYGEPAGYRPLREAIAARLGTTRAVRCAWQQVVIVSGSQQGVEVASRLLLDPGDAVWVEDPGYPGIRGVLADFGARLVHVPVDEEGLDVAAGEELGGNTRMACVCPSHQYPAGVTMSLRRRLSLLDWASRSGAWVLEDDYASEFRYAGRPLAALQALDAEDRVIYLGTFSLSLFPALRLGYLVVPPDLVDAFAAARGALSDRHAPTIEQAVLADFFVGGHFDRHVRRMRTIYAERQAVLVEEANRRLEGLISLDRAEAGLHLVGRLPSGVDDLEASRRAEAHGVEAPALSSHTVGRLRSRGLLLGYAALNYSQIHEGVRDLEVVLA